MLRIILIKQLKFRLICVIVSNENICFTFMRVFARYKLYARAIYRRIYVHEILWELSDGLMFTKFITVNHETIGQFILTRFRLLYIAMETCHDNWNVKEWNNQ